MLAMTPYVILIAASLALILSDQMKSGYFWIWLVIPYFATLSLEVIGVQTGFIFGDYSYGSILGYKVGGVPLIIGMNWILLTAGAYSLSNLIVKSNLIKGFLCAILLVVFDYLLEPVAIRFGYWSWEDNVIPMRNYLAWFVISLISAMNLIYFNINMQNRVFIHYYVSMTMFFAILNFK